jgi:hypothetical protein
MSTHEEVIGRLSHTTYKSGTGSGGTRNISGTTIHHKELETALAQWHRKNAALLFNGAYAANVTTLQTLGKNIPGLVFISKVSGAVKMKRKFSDITMSFILKKYCEPFLSISQSLLFLNRFILCPALFHR